MGSSPLRALLFTRGRDDAFVDQSVDLAHGGRLAPRSRSLPSLLADALDQLAQADVVGLLLEAEGTGEQM